MKILCHGFRVVRKDYAMNITLLTCNHMHKHNGGLSNQSHFCTERKQYRVKKHPRKLKQTAAKFFAAENTQMLTRFSCKCV